MYTESQEVEGPIYRQIIPIMTPSLLIIEAEIRKSVL